MTEVKLCLPVFVSLFRGAGVFKQWSSVPSASRCPGPDKEPLIHAGRCSVCRSRVDRLPPVSLFVADKRFACWFVLFQ